jgi:hypothetical protein
MIDQQTSDVQNYESENVNHGDKDAVAEASQADDGLAQNIDA